jgi:hypothetical protein
MEKEQKANHYSCSYNRAAWEKEREDQFEQHELASLVWVHDIVSKEGTEGELLLVLP